MLIVTCINYNINCNTHKNYASAIDYVFGQILHERQDLFKICCLLPSFNCSLQSPSPNFVSDLSYAITKLEKNYNSLTDRYKEINKELSADTKRAFIDIAKYII